MPFSRLALRATAGVVALLTAASGVLKIRYALGQADPGPAAGLLSYDALAAVGALELGLALLLPWTRTAFSAALLLIGDYATYVLALVATQQPYAAAGVVLLINILTIILWSFRPRRLGGHPGHVEIALVD